MPALTFDALRTMVGSEIGASPWIPLDQERITAFAVLTQDEQYIHVDPERAKESRFGTTIAHGYLLISLLPRLLGEIFVVEDAEMLVNYGLDKLRFPSPVRVGSRIRLHATVVSVEDVPGDGVQVSLDFTVEVEGSDKPACIARALYRYYA